jgi:alpha-2-macroglobulin
MIRRLLLLLALLVAVPAYAQAPLDRVQRADGAQVVPDHFLRRWDPLTVLFAADTGPAQPAAEDQPERYVTMTPPQPGAWRWLGPRTLQFRPAEAWTPLARVAVTVSGRTTTLIPLLPEPVQTTPDDTTNGIAALDTIGLTFPDPVDTAALARLLTIELRPLPGIDATGAQTLTAQDFDIRPQERASRTDPQSYLVLPHAPLPDGRLAIVRLRLADAPGLDEPIFEKRIRTATPFAVASVRCGDALTDSGSRGLLDCRPADYATGVSATSRSVIVMFSATPQLPDVMAARNALRISPPVDDLDVSRYGSDEEPGLLVRGSFASDTEYTLRIAAGTLTDARRRPLAGAETVQRFAFRAAPPALAWDAAQGVVERDGPQMVPLRGHGYARADIRIHRIDPLDRDFWPFPKAPLVTSDDAAPPLPGNEPAEWTDARAARAAEIAARIKALGSPSVSDLIDLPQAKGGADAKFGIDLAPYFTRIAGAHQAGTYLIGLRPLQAKERQWLRVQVTDLSLTAVEEPTRVRFAVTSLAAAQPVAGAQVRVEGLSGKDWATLAQGVTDADGGWTYAMRDTGTARAPQRVVVVKGTDTLVTSTHPGPAQYANGAWNDAEGTWLTAAFAKKAATARAEKVRFLCHVFTERPIYRPEEAVEVRGFVRSYLHGALSYAERGGTLLITGPDQQEWRFPITLDDTSGFYLHFDAKTPATGEYTVTFQPEHADSCGNASFRKEAYKLPIFEVLLNAADHVPLDAPFPVNLLARYYAGGGVSDRPIKWRVTQFPYNWKPPGREGFLFSSDSRFAADREFRSTPVLNSEAKTDAGGSATLTLDPTVEPTAQPRTYAVEATVTGDDGSQIRNVAHVVALPPFVLGAKLPRYIDKPGSIPLDLLALDADGKPRAGLDVDVKLIKRDWNSTLQASDFSQGSAKYVTQEIDRTVEERHVATTDAPQPLSFAANEAGVYQVELSAGDRLGRKQVLRVDLFMAGDTPVTWSRPPAKTVTVNTDKDDYAPGETATLLIESPFQTARALIVTEQPEGTFDYAWADVTNGVGRAPIEIRKEQMPRLATHVLLMRGRLPGPAPAPTAPFDQGKPTTLAATTWVKVRPVENRVEVAFDAPATARPAQTIDVTLRLTDANKKPLAGEATFWMVDQAVLALAAEAPLDPLPDFIVQRPSRMAARDTRNLAFGIIPLNEMPGGGEGEANEGVENISVRRNFTPVPIYLPHVKVGPDGIAHVQVKLPDTLTVFKLRAVVTSGQDRFGFGTGELRVRQPVVAQPVLPRFLRPGDAFDATVLGRIVEGPGGGGTASAKLDGLTLTGAASQTIAWTGTAPARANFPVTVNQPAAGNDIAKLLFTIRRDADQVGDAVEIALPIRPDRSPVRARVLADVAGGNEANLPPLPASFRPGTLAASLTVATDPALVRVVGGLDFLIAYPFGCTEQRIALASSELALLPFAPLADAETLKPRVAGDVAAALRAIDQSVDENGLVGFWPHTRGLVTLTAWSYELMLRAEAAKLPVDTALRDRLATVLTQALRSDYPHLLTNAALLERATALYALAVGGKLDAAYASELARLAGALSTDGLAMVVSALATTPNADRALLADLLTTMWTRVQILARDGKPQFAGLSDYQGDPLILPSETRGLAEVMRAVAAATPQEPRLPLLRAGLVSLGGADGWGNTNATAAALRALAAGWDVGAGDVSVSAMLPDGPHGATLGRALPMQRWSIDAAGTVRVRNAGNRPVLALQESSYVPVQPGAQAEPMQNGFVVARALARVPASGPMQQIAPGADGALHLASGDIVEESANVVNPEDRTMVAIALPIAAGFEPLNPALATAPTEAAPSAPPTLAPTYTAFGDDSVLYVYETLPKGTYTFRFRAQAAIAGSFTEPPGSAETMYRTGIYGASAGARVVIAP